MNVNTAQDELVTLRLELRAQERTLHLFDKKADRLEQAYQHQSDKLDEIENKISAIEETLEEIKDLISQQKGSSATKAKITNNFYMVATITVTLLAALSDLALKVFGR